MATLMARYTVHGGDVEVIVASTPDGRVSLEVVPPGPFVTDPETMQEVRIMMGAAILVAHNVPVCSPAGETGADVSAP